MQLSMFSAEEPPAKTTASGIPQGAVRPGLVWMETVLASPSLSPELWSASRQIGSSGKMFRMSYRHGIPADFSALPQTLPKAGIMSHGECWISETLGSPTSLAPVCSWSDIVIQDAPRRFYLSRTALAGIARRDRKPRLFSQREGEWLSMIERHAFWTRMGQG